MVRQAVLKTVGGKTSVDSTSTSSVWKIMFRKNHFKFRNYIFVYGRDTHSKLLEVCGWKNLWRNRLWKYTN